MSRAILSTLAAAVLCLAAPVWASTIVTTEQQNAVSVTFTTIPNISATDLAESAAFSSTGTPHPSSGAIGVLHDGVFPADGSVGAAYFSDTDDLSITVNLGSLVNIGEVNTYSSDASTSVNRSPQDYTLYGSTNNLSFTLLATVTNNGGHFSQGFASSWGNSITDTNGSLGVYQYLRFDTLRINQAPNGSGFIGTFLNEIDVLPSAPEPASMSLLACGSLLLLRRRK